MFVDREELAAAFERLKDLPFPKHPSDLEFADWLLELAEIDGHVAGLAMSAIGSSRPSTFALDTARTHADRLRELRVIDVDDQLIYDDCLAYVDAVVSVEKVLSGEDCGRG